MEKESMQTTYTENDRSMLRYVYDCVFFVARKPADICFDNEEDDQLSSPSSPPAAKSPRRESTDSLTWQEILWHWQWTWRTDFLFYFNCFHMFFLWSIYWRNVSNFAGHLAQIVEYGIEYCNTMLSITSKKRQWVSYPWLLFVYED